MDPQPNFGDPEFEPTDEQLRALSREAFADVAERYHAALASLRAHVEELRSEALERLASVQGAPAPPAPRS